MKDYLNDLAAFLANKAEPHHDTERKLELLTRAVANLIDEVLILRSILQDVGEIDDENWREMYQEMKLSVLFSSAGPTPPSVFKFRRFFMAPQETAAALIPDEKERTETIDHLTNLSQ